MVKFTNWTNKDFTGVWGKIPHTFPAGETKDVSLGGESEAIAKHFAKHLVDRYLIESGKRTDDVSRGELEAKCFGVVEEETAEEEPKEKPVAKKKAAKKAAKKVVEEEFEGLKE